MQGEHVAHRRALSVAAVLLAAGAWCAAQESRGSITGKITDPQNALVPNAAVKVTNTATNVSRNTVTNQTGYYEVSFLDPGPYKVEITAAGFKKTTRGPITLDVGNRLTVDVQLQIGAATQSVDVTADAPLLETASAAQGRVLDSREMAQLPMGTMNPFLMQAMAAGTIFTGSLQPNNNRAMDNAASASYASGGLSSGTNEFLLDGTPITGTNGNRAGFVPTQEAVDEMRVETSPYDASLGHAVGDYVMATTKTGTNTLHGSGFWQFQQIRWNATPHYTRLAYESGLANGTIAPGTPEQASGRISQPGFSLGGPVYIPHVINGKDKLFFFITYSKLTSIAPPAATPIYSVPTPAERNGDFSALLVGTVNPTQYIVYDPRSAAPVNGHVTRTPFPGNI
ncbi:MAG TPA: carboxypeptidase-like regulatory domain-containing protein, partial [Candidatus Sulfopaludibacter sp.]|nr:carboxypeptidase-like regulatory domain-containing protein [Candidatus Sulfopaludibacter sp.]